MIRFIFGFVLVLGAAGSYEMSAAPFVLSALVGIIGLAFAWSPVVDGTIGD